MKFGFIAHPTSVELKRHVKMIDMMGRSLEEQDLGWSAERWRRRNLVPLVDFGRITSAAGAWCEGIVHYMPLTAEEMIADPRTVAARVVEGVEELRSRGAAFVGLGGFTGIVGNRGLQTIEKTGIPVTTGNSLTAYAAYRNVLDAMAQLEVEPAGTEVAVVGYPGSICLAVAKLLATHGCRLLLVHRGDEAQGRKHLEYLPEAVRSHVRLSSSMEAAYADVRFFVAATSSGGVIDPMRLLPGSVVVDAALPKDVLPQQGLARTDVLLVDGGLVSAGDRLQLGSQTMGLSPKKFLNGCLAETLVLALEQRAESFSIGRELPEDKVLEIGRMAERHGLLPWPMASEGQRLRAFRFEELRRFHRGAATRPAVRTAAGRGDGVGDTAREGGVALGRDGKAHDVEARGADEHIDRAEVLRAFSEHINPVLREFFHVNHIERVFTQGQGCWLTEHDGRRYLDFVAGYGCLNTGHNHPRINEALQRHLSEQRPSFVQYVSVPAQASQLAARLAALSPGGALSRVFFTNSGTEAVEAAIKLALAAMEKPKVLYCDNGYHGKTLGALSVTGRAKHRTPFEPLLPRCESLPFGDVEALEAALAKGDVGAFILEPIQGEGGVIVPPEGYLRRVRELCDAHGCLMVLDEIQTGLGRTGKLFACEWEGVVPDIMVLAKSLSGGAVPIGATLCRPALWERAYGSIDRCVLHTSTFGGGNFAAAAGLATLDVIEQERLADHALEVGNALRSALTEVASGFPFVREVRGRGLMIAIEFENSFAGAVEAFAREFAARIPGDAASTYRMLSGKAKHHLEEAMREVERNMEEMFVLRVVSKLSMEHGILTFVTANSNKVLRIQPPLVLSMDEALRFVEAFGAVCRDMATFQL